tara:strand:- start:316 stop:834 length:519 start_codon:yes stop_codon:yes gene_type:complete
MVAPGAVQPTSFTLNHRDGLSKELSKSELEARARAVETATCSCEWAAEGCGEDDGSACWSMCCDEVYKVLRISRAPNPFASRELATSHVFRSHLSKLQGSLDHGVLHHGKLHNTPTAVWIDSKAALVPLRHTLADLAKQEPPPTLVLVVYNLPNRDCAQRVEPAPSAIDERP